MSNKFFPPELWDNVKKYGRAGHARDDNIIWGMRFAWWVIKATNTYSEYVKFIAFPHQYSLRERVWILPLHVHCLFCFLITGSSLAQLVITFCVGENAAAMGRLILKIWGNGRKIIPDYCSRFSAIEINILEIFVLSKFTQKDTWTFKWWVERIGLLSVTRCNSPYNQ
jgi:hypothetical protein